MLTGATRKLDRSSRAFAARSAVIDPQTSAATDSVGAVASQNRVLESAMRCLADGVIIVDTDGHFLFFNEAAERIVGLGALDVEPSEWSTAYGCYLPDKVTPYPPERLPLARAMRGEFVVEAEVFIRNEETPSGVWLSVNGTPLQDETGAYTGAAVVFRDITALRNSEGIARRHAKAVEKTTDAVFITDAGGRIEYVNPAFENITGYRQDEAVGRRPNILKSGVQNQEYYERLWQRLLAGNVHSDTLVNRTKDGEFFHAEQTITPVTDGSGIITNFVSVMRDTTVIRKAEQQEVALGLARDVQQRLYPAAPPKLAGYDLAGAAFPAEATCGDYFDFIEMPNGDVCMALGDVTGHGFGSALLMAETRAYLRSLVRTTSDLAEILSQLNEFLFFDTEPERFVTLVLACLDPSRRRLVYASAGHISGYVLASDGSVKSELDSTGLPLGMFSGVEFGCGRKTQLVSGDQIVLWTDGVTESQDDDGDFLGAERALRVLSLQCGDCAEDIVSGLYTAIKGFSSQNPQADDVTAVLCKVL